LLGFCVASVYGILQALHVVFGRFYALLAVCAIRGMSLHAVDLWRRFDDMKLSAKSPAGRVELRVD